MLRPEAASVKNAGRKTQKAVTRDTSRTRNHPATKHGEMAEWSIATVLNTVSLQGLKGSNPFLSSSGSVAQRPEQGAFNLKVVGSNPTRPTNIAG